VYLVTNDNCADNDDAGISIGELIEMGLVCRLMERVGS